MVKKLIHFIRILSWILNCIFSTMFSSYLPHLLTRSINKTWQNSYQFGSRIRVVIFNLSSSIWGEKVCQWLQWLHSFLKIQPSFREDGHHFMLEKIKWDKLFNDEKKPRNHTIQTNILSKFKEFLNSTRM